jgi:NADH:ubiquinone oxidoreductase subunit 6 (subunit J)
MSFGNLRMLSGVQEVLSLVLMIVAMMAVIYLPDIDLVVRVGIAVFAFAVIMLVNLATALLKQQKEIRERQMKQA